MNLCLAVSCLIVSPSSAQELTRETASRFARSVLASVTREYPNKLDHTLASGSDVQSPRALHPAFFGCFDWHSSVHGHWLLVKVLKTYPDLPEAAEIRKVLDDHLAPDRIQVETAYLAAPGNRGFERPYGWAWLLKLAAELNDWDTPEGRRWSAQLKPLADAVTGQFRTFLPKLTYPTRTGTHPNTAFSLGLALDYARITKDASFEQLLLERARTYFGGDRQGPLAWEPGGEDFLSPCLEEAALMAKVLDPKHYRAWLSGFLPGLLKPGALKPACVSDRTDPRIVHLDGLNLSRARCLHILASTFGKDEPQRKFLEAAAVSHATAALPHVLSGNYEGEHWLATFAVLMGEGGLPARHRRSVV